MTNFEDHPAQSETTEASIPCSAIFLSNPTAMVIYDQANTILQINPAARALFEIDAETTYKGMTIQQFIHHYQIRDQQQKLFNPEKLVQSIQHGKNAQPGEIYVQAQLPSNRILHLQISCAPLLDAQHQSPGTVCVCHDITSLCQESTYTQQAYTSLFTLIKAIIHIPDLIDTPIQEGSLLLPPTMRFIEQQLVDIIRQTLNGQWAFLMAIERPKDRLYYAAISGLSAEQRQRREENNGKFSPSDFLEPHHLAHLQANKPLTITYDRIQLPFLNQSDLAPLQTLLVPLFLQERFAGIFVISKPHTQDESTLQEITLVQSIALLMAHVIDCVRLLNMSNEDYARELVLQETQQQINSFLTLASHELRTPLTTIMGNIQLSLRRMQALKKYIINHEDKIHRDIERIRQPLQEAELGARIQKRMIGNMIDDIHIQNNDFSIHIKRGELLKIIHAAIKQQRFQTFAQRITLQVRPEIKEIPVLVDPERITQVITTYLLNALQYSPTQQSVEIRVAIEGKYVCVSVHDQGPGIPLEEQEQIWTRFYRSKGQTPQHELDLSMGLSFYINREIILHHHGEVGLKSAPGQGSIFWFTLPLPEKNRDRPLIPPSTSL